MLNFKIVIGEPLNCGSPSRKQLFGIDDLVLGGIAAGAGSLLGGIFSGSSQANAQDKANQTNLQIARETNASNEKLWQNQANYQTQMWNETNDYNSPQKQKERLLAAGINPSAVFGNGSMAEASNLSAPSANPAVGAHVEPVNYAAGISDGISNGLNAFFDSQLKNKEIERKGYENKMLNSDSIWRDLHNKYQVKILEEEAKGKGLNAIMAQSELAYIQAINGQRISQAFNATRLQDKQIQQIDAAIINQELTNRLSQIQIAYAPKLNEAQLKQYYATVNQIAANIGLINSNKMLTDEQRLHEVEKRASTIVDYNLKGLDYQLRKATKKYVIDTYKYESEQAGKENRDYEANWWNRTIQGYSPFASGSATATTKHMLKIP